jgi:hypothetical protein
MRPRIFFAMLLTALAAYAVILDRIAVTVGKHVITESDVLRDLRVSAFLDQKPLDRSGDNKRKTADRLVDQLLILQEAALSRFILLEPGDGAKLLAPVKSQFPDDPSYQASLAHYGITEADLTEHLLAGLRAMRFTDLRFRPEVQLSDDDLHDFYNTLVADGSRENRAPIPSFEASRDQVEKLLTDQRTAQALDRWLGTQRTDTQILYRDPAFQ